jgi:hypothetical protein
LAGQWNRLPEPSLELPHELLKSAAQQPGILKLAAPKVLPEKSGRAIGGRRRFACPSSLKQFDPFLFWHSRGILPSPHRNSTEIGLDLWVIESSTGRLRI